MAIIPADEKVFMVDKRTNTIYGGSQALQDMQQWYTMQDVSDSVQPYKVFTALLTQIGESDQLSTDIGGDPIIVGQTYMIADNGGSGWDFTNIGAPNNNIGTYFIATGTTPNSWGIDGQLNYNTGAPVATVLENTIGNIWFTYDSVGNYSLYSNNLFTIGKTAIPNPNGNSFWSQATGISTSLNILSFADEGDANYLLISSNKLNFTLNTNENLDGLFGNILIEIRVYS